MKADRVVLAVACYFVTRGDDGGNGISPNVGIPSHEEPGRPDLVAGEQLDQARNRLLVDQGIRRQLRKAVTRQVAVDRIDIHAHGGLGPGRLGLGWIPHGDLTTSYLWCANSTQECDAGHNTFDA